MFGKINNHKIIFKLIFIFINLNLNLNSLVKINSNATKNTKNIFFFEKEYSNKTILFQKINEYIRLCRNETLISDISYNKDLKTKISIVIPTYNSYNTIK